MYGKQRVRLVTRRCKALESHKDYRLLNLYKVLHFKIVRSSYITYVKVTCILH
jgi:hypothetical protein